MTLRICACIVAVVASSVGCKSGDSWRLSRTECEEWLDLFLNPSGGPSPWEDLGASSDESDVAFVERTRSTFMAHCLDGAADRQELECLKRATTDREHTLCLYEGEERRKRRDAENAVQPPAGDERAGAARYNRDRTSFEARR